MFNVDRDPVVWLFGEYGNQFVFRPHVVISAGEGRNITAVSFGGLSYTLRADFLRFGKFLGSRSDYRFSDLERRPRPILSVGISYSFNDWAVRHGGQLEEFMTVISDPNSDSHTDASNDLKALFVAGLFKHKRFSCLFEYSYKKGNKRHTLDAVDFLYTTDSGWLCGRLFVSLQLGIWNKVYSR